MTLVYKQGRKFKEWILEGSQEYRGLNFLSMVSIAPDRQKKLVAARVVLHKDELLANWELAREDQSLFRIDPLR